MRLTILLALLLPVAAYAGDASSYGLRKGIDSGNLQSNIKPGYVGYHSFSSVRNSAVFYVSRKADVCLSMSRHSESETGASIEVRRVVSGGTENGSFAIAPALTGCNCVQIAAGSYYLNVTQSPESADALVTVMGRE